MTDKAKEQADFYPYNGLNEITELAGRWANKTFAPDGEYIGRNIVEHLKSEVVELAEDPTDMEEVADCMLLLMHLAYQNFVHHGGEPARNAVLGKLQVNMKRKWGKRNEKGFCEHIRDN